MKMLDCFPPELKKELSPLHGMIFDIRMFANRPCVMNTASGEVRTKFEMEAETLSRTAQ